jgi:thioredoxin reductase (NADPH)
MLSVENQICDLVIVGAGPAGLTAAIYARRAGKSVMILEKETFGGQITHSPKVENYPGFLAMSGVEFADKLMEQAMEQGAEIELDTVVGIGGEAGNYTVKCEGGEFFARTVIIATGSKHRTLGLEGEFKYTGEGISYCAVCDGAFYRGKTVVVVGGGNTAVADAMLLSRIAKKVILVHRRDTLKATKIYHDPLMRAENVEFRWNSEISSFIHDKKLKGVVIKDLVSGAEEELECDGVFVSVGRKPATGLVVGQLELDQAGYIVADESTETNIPGVFAVGDVRTKALRQVVTAVADGATAVHYAEEYLSELQ